MTLGLAKRVRQRSGDCGFKNVFAKSVGLHHCAAAFFWQVSKSCPDLEQTLLFILILGTYSKLVLKTKMLTLGVGFPQPCPSASRSVTGKGRGLLKSHGLSETPIVWRNTSDTFT